MDKPLLSELRTWRGYWWPPGEEDKAMPGTLTYRPDEGLVLDLIGGWDTEIVRVPWSGGVWVGGVAP